jgi:hypothetical protein
LHNPCNNWSAHSVGAKTAHFEQLRSLTDANEMYKHNLKVYGILELIDKYDLMEVNEKPKEADIINPKEVKEEPKKSRK